MRPTYCLELAYEGTRFFGWQSQPHGNTVQDITEAAIANLLGVKSRLVPASRTDTGVHAAQQFAIFRLAPGVVLADDFAIRLNELLPETIKIRCAFKVPDTFHPRKDAKSKIYCYRLFFDHSKNNDLIARHWRLYKPLDISCLRQQLATLVGTHDFTSFCARGGKTKTCVRTIESIQIQDNSPSIDIRFKGPGFLNQIIRIIIGSAVSAAGLTSKAPSLADILMAKNRRVAPAAAPGEGLTLEQILY